MNRFGWCMWQTMHWLVGMARVKACCSGCAGSLLAMVGSSVCEVPRDRRRIGARVLEVAVVGVDDVAGGAAGLAIVAGLVVGAHEPKVRVVETRLGDVEDRDGDARAGAGSAIGWRESRAGPAPRCAAARPANRGGRSPGTDCRYCGRRARRRGRRRRAGWSPSPAADRAAAGCWRRTPPSGPSNSDLQQRRRCRRGVGLAENVVLEVEDAVVVGRAAPEHDAGRHQAALRRLDDVTVAGAAGLARHAIVAGIHEADEFRRFAVEQRIGALRVGARRIVPLLGKARQHVRIVHGLLIVHGSALDPGGEPRVGGAAMAIGAAEIDGGVAMHGRVIGLCVARAAALALAVRHLRRLVHGRRRCGDVMTRDRLTGHGRVTRVRGDAQAADPSGQRTANQAQGGLHYVPTSVGQYRFNRK